MQKHKLKQHILSVFGWCSEEKYVVLWSHYPHMSALYQKTTFLCCPCAKEEKLHTNNRDSCIAISRFFFLTKQLDCIAGRPCVSNMWIHDQYKVITLALILYRPLYLFLTTLMFPFSMSCPISGPPLSPSRLFQSSSSGWRWRRTSSKSVWRTKWRSECISKIETKPRVWETSWVTGLGKRWTNQHCSFKKKKRKKKLTLML